MTTVGRSVITTTAPAAASGGSGGTSGGTLKPPGKGPGGRSGSGASTPVAVVGGVRSKEIVTHFNDMSGNHVSVVGLVVASVSNRSWECALNPARGGSGGGGGGVGGGGGAVGGGVGGGGAGAGEQGVSLERPMAMEEVRRRLAEGPYPLFVQLSDMVELAVSWAPPTTRTHRNHNHTPHTTHHTPPHAHTTHLRSRTIHAPYLTLTVTLTVTLLITLGADQNEAFSDPHGH